MPDEYRVNEKLIAAGAAPHTPSRLGWGEDPSQNPTQFHRAFSTGLGDHHCVALPTLGAWHHH